MRLITLISTFLFCNAARSISPITPKGSKLYDGEGNQFYAKGVGYSSPASYLVDLLADGDQCQLDAGMMRTLGVNTINVYYVDARNNHDVCMQTFAQNGIYVWLSLTNPTAAFDRTKPTWTKDLFDHFSNVMDEFAKYDNVLAFTIGNEVINNARSTIAAPYLKAALRDMKAYRDAKGYRKIPIGYSAAEVYSLLQMSGNYLACGDEAESLDIYGMIVYSWCNNSNYVEAGYDKLYLEFQKYPKPVLFTETGCSKDGRDFSDVSAMLGPIFEPVFSGTIVYDWSENGDGYGLVEYSNSNNTGFPTTLPAFDRLSTVFSEQKPTGTPAASYTPSNSPPECPASTANWSVSASAALPTIANLHLDQVTAVTTYVTPNATMFSSSTISQGSSAADPRSSNTEAPSGSVSSKLDTSTKIAIAVGIVGGLLMVGGVVGWFFIRRQKRAVPKDPKGGTILINEDVDDAFERKPELPAQSIKPVRAKAELDSGMFTIAPWKRRTRILNLGKIELDATSQDILRNTDQVRMDASKSRAKPGLYELPAS